MCTPWHVPVGALGGARADVRGGQPGGFRCVCTPWHVPVGALGGARADVGGAQSGGFRGVCTPWRVPVGGMKTYDMLAPNGKIYNDILVFRHNISMYHP